MLVSIVGLDGAGKSTATRHVAVELPGRNHPARRIERWDIIDDPIYPATRFMRPDVPDTRLCVAQMPNPSRFLFLMWSIGFALAGRDEEPYPGTTLLDGYWMKHAAAEIVYGLDRPWVESVVAAMPDPDLVIYLRLDPETAWARKVGVDVVPYECGMDPDCTRESFLKHQYAMQEVLSSWSRQDGWLEVDASSPLPELVHTISDAVTAAAPAGRGGTPAGGRP